MNSKIILNSIKILMLEDQEDDAELIKRALQKGGLNFEALRVDAKDTFVHAIEHFQPDVIISDHALPQFDSLEALKVRKERLPNTPFILVTGAVSDEFAVQCIKLGADDYILKSNLSRLSASVKNAIEYHELILTKKRDAAALQEQNARLVKVNSEIDFFVYSVSHNLRAPLASILGLVNVARLEVKAQEFNPTGYLNLIEQSIQKLDNTIKEILHYSRNERTEIVPESIDFPSLVRECLERIQYLPNYSRIEIITSFSDQIQFRSDIYRLTTILSNLFSNSVVFMDEGKLKNTLYINVFTNSKSVEIEVKDNGIGIHPKHQHHVFKMFYRGTEKSNGAGLGLYIVHETIKKLQGTISFISDYGLQTTFRISIPNNPI
jgi:signal transduction histidine kinase